MDKASSLPSTFARWLKRLHAERDLTQEALAEQVACSVQTIRFFETGKRRPSLEMAERLALVLQVPAGQIEHFIRTARQPIGATATPDVSSPSATTTPPEAAPLPAMDGPIVFRPPVPPTDLIGRGLETNVLLRLLCTEKRRLVTIVGPGGIGKTRLALHLAHMLSDYPEHTASFAGGSTAGDGEQIVRTELQHGRQLFTNGALFVPLAARAHAAEIPAAVAGAMNRTVAGEGSPAAQLAALLSEQVLLLVLDNVEHLLALDGDHLVELLAHLIQHVPTVRLLLTSRERLRMAGEHVLELGGLALPAHSETLFASAVTAEAAPGTVTKAMAESEAVLLFVQRARQVSPAFALTPANQQAVLRICAAADGLPLGIELAAAWARTLTVDEIANEITNGMESGLDFLVLHERGAPPRHRSLRAVFEHSWALLTPEEQRAAAQLAVFRGGFERDAAYAVAGATLAHLAILIDKSLVQSVETTYATNQATGEHATPATIPSTDGNHRYQIHELLRQFLLDKLRSTPNVPNAEEQTNRRHALYFVELAAQMEQHLYAQGSVAWRRRGEQEQGNLRAALEWTLTHRNDPTLGLQLAGILGRFWYQVGLWQEGRGWLQDALGLAGPVAPPALRAQAFTEIGILQHSLSEYADAQANLSAALSLWSELGDTKKQAWTYFQIGILASTVGDIARAKELFGESLQRYREVGDPWYVATVLMQLASMIVHDSDSTRAVELLEEVAPIYRKLNHTGGMGVVFNLHGWALLLQEDLAGATQRFTQALEIGRRNTSPQLVAWSLRNMGVIQLLKENYTEAGIHLRACLDIYRQMGYKSGAIITLEVLATVAAEEEHPVYAVRMLAVAETLRATTGQPRSDFEENMFFRRTITTTKAKLTRPVWQLAWDEGCSLSLQEAYVLALQMNTVES